MKYKKLFIALIILAAGFTSCEKANIDVDTTPADGSAIGEVSGVWAKGSTQVIKGDIVIPAGKSLTIEEGVTVLMDTIAKPEIIVKGNLYALGTEQNPVRFTVNEFYKTDAKKFGKMWGGILAGPTCAELVLDHTILEYGGSATSDASTSVKQGLYKACTYIEGGKIIFANNTFYTTGVTGGEAMNFKSGCLADVAYNLVYSTNTNALKLSNSGDRTPQAYIIAYNNTMVNTGWRRPTAKGGSVWLEATVRTELYNNLFVNTRFGVKRDTKKPEDSRSVYSNNYYYGFDQATVNQFQPTAEIVAGTNDVISKTAGANDPKFVNYPLNTPTGTAVFTTSWDFHLLTGSPALTKGKTNFARHHAAGIIANGINYKSPEPAAFVGAFGAK
ncbi:MAG: right-handed parallel beta-helix repeat-containing protein [Sphingobacteriaceae bacterium]|nr:MAG: right-handed parallel beta-helix repeat-containing protein [Sphingobacteriaceae bacterium]